MNASASTTLAVEASFVAFGMSVPPGESARPGAVAAAPRPHRLSIDAYVVSTLLFKHRRRAHLGDRRATTNLRSARNPEGCCRDWAFNLSFQSEMRTTTGSDGWQGSGEPGEKPGETPGETPLENGEGRRAGANTRVSAGHAASKAETSGTRLLTGSSARPSPTRRSADELRWSLARHLTDRDRALVRLVARHRVLTTPQLARLFFDPHKRASARLNDLLALRVLDRFRPHRDAWGAHPWHWVLGPLGAGVLAAERDDDPDRASRRWRGERVLAYATGQRIGHLVGTNEVFVSLAEHCRRNEGARLVEWLTESECAQWSRGIVRPDGLGVWEEGGRSAEFFLEYDRGTETLGRVVRKLRDYEKFESERGASSWVLFMFESERREQRARHALTGATVPVATAVVMRPHDAVWLPLDGTYGRVRLASLADLPKPPDAIQRAERSSTRVWHYDRSRRD